MTLDDMQFAAALLKLGIECAVIVGGSLLGIKALQWLDRRSSVRRERRMRRMPERIIKLQPRRS